MIDPSTSYQDLVDFVTLVAGVPIDLDPPRMLSELQKRARKMLGERVRLLTTVERDFACNRIVMTIDDCYWDQRP